MLWRRASSMRDPVLGWNLTLKRFCLLISAMFCKNGRIRKGAHKHVQCNSYDFIKELTCIFGSIQCCTSSFHSMSFIKGTGLSFGTSQRRRPLKCFFFRACRCCLTPFFKKLLQAAFTGEAFTSISNPVY